MQLSGTGTNTIERWIACIFWGTNLAAKTVCHHRWFGTCILLPSSNLVVESVFFQTTTVLEAHVGCWMCYFTGSSGSSHTPHQPHRHANMFFEDQSSTTILEALWAVPWLFPRGSYRTNPTLTWITSRMPQHDHKL